MAISTGSISFASRVYSAGADTGVVPGRPDSMSVTEIQPTNGWHLTDELRGSAC
ncbi:hypothetical protein B0G76_2079 [Paraburkholderia sp. BL23I1N1]|nr:hypothetical protein B0G76_2079 [Paraburkholderia sp. BL23I1N1]